MTEEKENENISWGKIIVLLVIGLIFLGVTIFGLIQNYYAIKAIAAIPKMVNDLEEEDTNIKNLGGLNYLTTSKECYVNNIKVNCSEIKTPN